MAKSARKKKRDSLIVSEPTSLNLKDANITKEQLRSEYQKDSNKTVRYSGSTGCFYI